MQKIREVIADIVASSGTTTAFALMGAANQELICDLGERSGVRLVHCRHEASAVGMADGYARFSGRAGVATVTAGPGVTNTATSLAVAQSHHSPVLLLAGDLPDADLRNPQRFEQERFTRLCAGESGRIESPHHVGAVLRSATEALAAHRPYALHMPLDVQEMPAPADWTNSVATRAERPVPPWERIQAIEGAALLTAAHRPTVLAGRGALCARGQLADLAALLGAPLVTTLRMAGLFAGEALEVGVAGPMGDGRGRAVLEEADLVLAVGTSLHPLAASALHMRQNPPVLIRVDTEPPADGLNYRADLRTDAAEGVDRLLKELGAGGLIGPASSWYTRNAQRGRTSPRGSNGAVHPLDALDTISGSLPEQRLLVIGGGHASLGACQLLPASGPRDFTCVSTDFGAIGQALPVAIGACFARPGERVFHVTGDGELLMALADFHTAVRYQLPLTIVVLNDHGFGQERHNLTRAGRPAHYANHASPDLVALAESMGASGYRVTHPAELVLLEQALAREQGVVLVDIQIDSAFLNPASAHVAAAMASQTHSAAE